MDMTSFLGFFAIAALAVLGLLTGGLPAVFLNWHGITIVLGGTFCALLVNTPSQFLFKALGSLTDLFSSNPYEDIGAIMDATVQLAQDVQSKGLTAFQNANGTVGKGYVAYASQVALEYNDPDTVYHILQDEIDRGFDAQNETINVFRTAGILAPMFGLLGTLIGIVEVLRQIANPAQVGPAMATAITTAFYGISLANMFCVPVSGKLRLRYWRESQAKSMVAEAISMTLRKTPPVIIARKLRSYLS